MKKIIRTFCIIFCAAMFGLFVTGCADANGLHNQESSSLTITFTNFTAASDGDYTLPGDFTTGTGNSWTDNTTTMLTIKDGEGSTTSAITATASNVYFTLVKTGSWTRQWITSVKGNAVDYSSGTYQNFYANIEMGTDVTITIDGSTSPATVTVK